MDIRRIIKHIICTPIICILFILTLGFSAWASENAWDEVRDAHFVVYYKSEDNNGIARHVLREAERYYDRIADQIGYSRYGGFWTWEDRARIFIYDSKEEFTRVTGLPTWSQAASLRDEALFRSRIIVTFAQEEELIENILPHEICHLIVKDFIGFDKSLPLWFEEGLAQLQESDKKELAERVMKEVSAKNMIIPFSMFSRYDVRKETEAVRVIIFYAQSISVMDFLIKKYGLRRFQQLCSFLKEGKNFDEAFEKAYISLFKSFNEVEDKWYRYING